MFRYTTLLMFVTSPLVVALGLDGPELILETGGLFVAALLAGLVLRWATRKEGA